MAGRKRNRDRQIEKQGQADRETGAGRYRNRGRQIEKQGQVNKETGTGV